MKAKQKNLRVFEIKIEDEKDFFSYMEKNLVLLKDYLLLIEGEVSSSITDFLDEKGCCYKDMSSCHIKATTKDIKPKELKPIEIVQYVEATDEKIDSNTLVFHKPIRSGTVVEHSGDIVIFARVNSGAKVICEGNLSIYDTIDGIVECDGDYMILKDINKGYAIFNGDILEKESFDKNIKKITKSENGPIIEDIF